MAIEAVKIKLAHHKAENNEDVDVYVVTFDERLKPLQDYLEERFQELDHNKLKFCHFNDLKRKIDDQMMNNTSHYENSCTNNIEERSYISIDMQCQDSDNEGTTEEDGFTCENTMHQLDDSNSRNEIEKNLELNQSEFLQRKREQFQSTIESIVEKLNEQDDRKSIIMIDELPLNLVASSRVIKVNNKKQLQYHVDMSYLNKFKNVEFILCIKPWGFDDAFKEYEFKLPSEPRENQHYHILKNMYRNNQAILEFKRFHQVNDPCWRRKGYPTIESNQEVLPQLLDPPNDVGVIWIHLWLESDSTKKVYFDKISSHLRKINGQITILYGGKRRAEPKQTAETFFSEYSNNGIPLNEPCEEFDFNGTEADVILYFSDGVLSLQTISRARQLLIIVSEDISKNYRDEFFSMVCYLPHWSWPITQYLGIDHFMTNEEQECIKLMNNAVKKNIVEKYLVKKLVHVNTSKVIKLVMLILLMVLFSSIWGIYNLWSAMYRTVNPIDP